MPDLLTHLVAARVPGTLVRDRRVQALLVIGTFLPDLASKGLYWVFQSRESFSVPTHSVVGVILISYLACLFVEESLRRPGFWALTMGGVIHILLDLIKDNQGTGASHLWNPFLRNGYELSWIDPENVIYLVPLDVAILGILWLLERRRGHVRQ
jgi:hypothetical protein